MANTQPFNRDHKTVTEARSLAHSFLASVPEAGTEPLPRGRRELNGKSRKNGGFRIPIETNYRWHAEKQYRMIAKNQLRRLLETSEGLVQNIAYCQPHDWRW